MHVTEISRSRADGRSADANALIVSNSSQVKLDDIGRSLSIGKTKQRP
jgi:hypothetical protein